MWLKAEKPAHAKATGVKIDFVEGETIPTENSYKRTDARFRDLAGRAGLNVAAHWISPAPEFLIYLLMPV